MSRVLKNSTGSLQVHRAGMGIYSQDWKSEEIKGEKGGDRDEDGGGGT